MMVLNEKHKYRQLLKEYTEWQDELFKNNVPCGDIGYNYKFPKEAELSRLHQKYKDEIDKNLVKKCIKYMVAGYSIENRENANFLAINKKIEDLSSKMTPREIDLAKDLYEIQKERPLTDEDFDINNDEKYTEENNLEL